MDIVFVRHGRTSINEQGRYGGVTDTEISTTGELEVEKLKGCMDNIEFDAVYVSPLKRTVQTAEILARDYKIDDRLKEMNFGIFEGLTHFEIDKMYPDEAQKWQGDFLNHRIRCGESLFDVFTRTKDFIEDMSVRYKRVLAITHGGVIRCGLSLVFQNPDYFYKFRVNHGTANIITINEGYFYIKGVNCSQRIKEILT